MLTNATLIDEIPISIHLVDKEQREQGTESTNNYKKPAAIQNQFSKMQSKENAGLKPSVRHRYSTDTPNTTTTTTNTNKKSTSSEIGVKDSTSSTIDIEIFNTTPSSISSASIQTISGGGDSSVQVVVMPRANRRKQKPYTIECMAAEEATTTNEARETIEIIEAMETTPCQESAVPQHAEILVESASSLLKAKPDSLTYSNLSLKFIDEATNSAPLSPEIVKRVSASAEQSQDNLSAHDHDSTESPHADEPPNREKHMKKRKQHRKESLANSKESLSKSGIPAESPDEVAVKSSVEAVNLAASSEALDAQQRSKQSQRNKDRRDRRQRHTIPLTNPLSPANASEKAVKTGDKNSSTDLTADKAKNGSAQSIQIYKQESITTTSSSDEDKERSRKNLKLKSSSFKRRNELKKMSLADAKPKTVEAVQVQVKAVNLPVEAEVSRVEHTLVVNTTSQHNWVSARKMSYAIINVKC